jgi:hypothetical protein
MKTREKLFGMKVELDRQNYFLIFSRILAS